MLVFAIISFEPDKVRLYLISVWGKLNHHKLRYFFGIIVLL